MTARRIRARKVIKRQATHDEKQAWAIMIIAAPFAVIGVWIAMIPW